MARHPYVCSDTPVAIAHRGGAHEAPENTLQAFEAAVELGYRYLETDAQLTADGVVVAFHDDSIDRVSNKSGAINSWIWDDLRQVEINGSGRLTTILDLLNRFPDRCFNLDAKSDEVVEPLRDAIIAADAFDRVCVGSFSDGRLRRLREISPPQLCTSLGPRAIAGQLLRTYRVPRGAAPGHAIQVPPSYNGIRLITKRFVDQAHRDGLAVHAWTIDEADEMSALLDLGVDGIMTDRPTVLKSVMQQRGLWD